MKTAHYISRRVKSQTVRFLTICMNGDTSNIVDQFLVKNQVQARQIALENNAHCWNFRDANGQMGPWFQWKDESVHKTMDPAHKTEILAEIAAMRANGTLDVKTSDEHQARLRAAFNSADIF